MKRAAYFVGILCISCGDAFVARDEVHLVDAGDEVLVLEHDAGDASVPMACVQCCYGAGGCLMLCEPKCVTCQGVQTCIP